MSKTANTSKGMYEQCAAYYRFIASGRDHFESQVQVIKGLLSRYRMERPKMLDAACGSGEVLNLLIHEGYDVFGSDGSPEMLDLARQIESLQNNSRLQALPCQWRGLNDAFPGELFDFIYIFGHALPHLPPAEVPLVIDAAYNKLKPGGVFAFDMRQWTRDGNDQLRESGRPVGIKRWKGEFERDGRKFTLDDCCTYSAGVQRITYYVRHLRPEDERRDQEFFLEYSLFDAEEVKLWFQSSPFCGNLELFVPATTKCPFVVVAARKALFS